MLPLTVVIPVFNGVGFVVRAVESVLSCDPGPEQIVLVDDGSTDGSAELEQALLRQYAGRVRLLCSGDGVHRGVSAARNRGVKAATTEWTAFLDADDYYYPHRFEEFSAAREAGRAFDAMYHACQIVFEKNYVPHGIWHERMCGVLEPLTGERLLQALLLGRSWMISGIVIRRDLLFRAGLFDERLSIGEDCHLWVRTACLGTIIPGRLAAPVAAYSRHGQNVTEKSDKTRLYKIELAWSILRWARGRKDLSRDRMRMLRQGFAFLLVDCLIYFRLNQQHQLARQAVGMALRADASVLYRPAVLRQIRAVLRESVKCRERGA